MDGGVGRSETRRPAVVRVILPVAVALLLAGLWGGLARLGWGVPGDAARTSGAHGIVMVLGFLGTVIGLERAVGLGRRWVYAAPLAAAVGAGSLLFGATTAWAGVALLFGGVTLFAAYVTIWRTQPAMHTVVMGLGAFAWCLAAAGLIAGWPTARIVPLGAGFLVLTIVGERLELSRLVTRGGWSPWTFLAALALALAGLVAVVATGPAGIGSVTADRLAGTGLVALALWLGVFDVARRTVRTPGVTRFMAIALLAGYAWMAAAGAIQVAHAGRLVGPPRDAALHALFVGFVLSMVAAHAPVIVPGVLGVPYRWRARAYAHLALLHASLLLRVAGDLGTVSAAIRWGGLLNVVAVLLFVVQTVSAVLAGRRAAASRPRS